MEEDNESIEPQREPSVQLALPRTRKAKETQFRLGVGRPAVAGGSGARAVTKSQSVSRGTGGKVSRSIKPKEEAIQEEEEGQSRVVAPRLVLIMNSESEPGEPLGMNLCLYTRVKLI